MNGLVLSGGGARAAYQAGVLSYVTEKLPQVSFPIITGVSAGAINAAFLAAHRGAPPDSLHALSDCWTSLTIERVFDASMIKVGLEGARWLWTFGSGGRQLKGFLDTAPLGEFLQQTIDMGGIEENVRSGRVRAVGLSATRWATGQTVTFVQGAEGTPTWERARRCGLPTRIAVEHVMASGALPLVFPAVKIDDEWYGDGSIRQATPLAPAIHLGADKLLAISTRYAASLEEVKGRATREYPPPAKLIGMLFNTVFLDTLDADVERLERLNRAIEALQPGTVAPDGLRPIKLLVVRPTKDLGEIAGEYRDKLPRSLRLLMRGLGVKDVRGPDLLSYLIFEEPYISRVIELGYEDALSQWPEIERFFTEP
jgi:NTE family protein